MAGAHLKGSTPEKQFSVDYGATVVVLVKLYKCLLDSNCPRRRCSKWDPLRKDRVLIDSKVRSLVWGALALPQSRTRDDRGQIDVMQKNTSRVMGLKSNVVG